MPTYWSLPVRLLSLFGWVPPPETLLWFFVGLSMALSALFIWKRRAIYMVAACIIWGMLFADTPYAILLPLVPLLAWMLGVRFARFAFCEDYVTRIRAPYGLFLVAFVTAALVTAALNVGRCKVAYVTGYVRNAVSALHTLDRPWRSGVSREMDAILNDYVAEIAREAKGLKWIFTDGLCDAGIELASNGEIRTLSVTGGTFDEYEWRRRGFSNWDDLASLESGAIGLIRDWTNDRPESLTNAAFQCGFDYLDQTVPGRLVLVGLVMRTREVVVNSSLHLLSQRIIAFYEKGYNPADGGFLRKLRFGAMQWRLARALRRQVTALDRARRLDDALAVAALSNRLDELNPFAKRTHDDAGNPHYALAAALKRADFAAARTSARDVLKTDHWNSEANFALAMNHMRLKEYTLARHYFDQALKGAPSDPALLNNRAMAEMELGDLNAAEASVRAALKVAPHSAAIRDTLRQIESRKMSRPALLLTR